MYEIIDQNPGLTINELSSKVKFSMRKVNRYLKKLVKDGMVKGNYYPIPWREMINWDKMENTNKPE